MESKIFFAGLFVFVLMASLVSAGFWDFFKKDVRESPVEATVSVANAAPTIVEFVGVFEDGNGDNVDDNGGTGFGTIQGLAVGTEGPGVVTVRFKFVAEDINGVDDLPGDVGDGADPI